MLPSNNPNFEDLCSPIKRICYQTDLIFSLGETVAEFWIWLNILLFGFFGRNCFESGDINLDKISILCCLNCVSECINGFHAENWSTLIIQT
jgi:hypothetical protein